MYHRVGTSAYKEGLENIETLAQMAAHPERKFKSIHIAGTNGKGSVAHLFSSLFQELGLKVGLYTSPHLVNFNERIKVNGLPMPESDILSFFYQYEKELMRIEPSFFEMTTMMAFDYFAKLKVDIAIIEVGLGGRLDATNIIQPELSLITNISLDHTQLLGRDLATIAGEKAGIIKSGIPVVIGEFNAETSPVFKSIANKIHSPIYFADQHFRIEEKDKRIDETMFCSCYQDHKLILKDVHSPLNGKYQLKNMATFLQGATLLETTYSITPFHLKNAIEHLVTNTGLTGRWQILSKNPLIICDVGHNQGAFEIITEQLLRLQYKKLHFVFGMVNDKDLDSVMTLLPKENIRYYLCKAKIERSLEPEILHTHMTMRKFDTIVCGSVKTAFDAAIHQAREDDVVFVGGSCFVVGELLGENDS